MLTVFDQDDRQHDQCLHSAQKCLKDHMGADIGTDMQSRAVFPLDNAPLAADRLDRVENTDPDACADDGKTAVLGLHKILKGFFAGHKRDQHRDDQGRHQVFPLSLVDKEPPAFADVNACLLPASDSVSHLLDSPFFTGRTYLHPLSYFLIYSSASPSPPSSLRLMRPTIPSSVSVPKKRHASEGDP